jgi:hypothetical protein
MWFGLLYLTPEDGDDVEHPTVMVVAYESHRLFKVGAPLPAAPGLIALLREAAAHGRNVGPPRCGSCDAPWDVPPLDGEGEPACASA